MEDRRNESLMRSSAGGEKDQVGGRPHNRHGKRKGGEEMNPYVYVFLFAGVLLLASGVILAIFIWKKLER